MFLVATFVIYSRVLPNIGELISLALYDSKNTNIYSPYNYLLDKFGFAITSLIFLSLGILLVYTIVKIKAPGDSLALSNFKLGKFTNRCLFGVYVAVFQRNTNIIEQFIIATILFVNLFISKYEMSYFSFLFIATNSVYYYVNSTSLRSYIFQKKYSVLKDYIYSILSQCISIFTISLPFVMISNLLNFSQIILGMYIVSVFSSVIVFFMIGLLFPPKKENPFSVIIGVAIIFIVMFSLIIVFFVLQLEKNVIILLLGLILVFVIGVSIMSMKRLYRKSLWQT
jgi:hypothetical protein